MTKQIEILVTFRGDPENTGAAETVFRAGANVEVPDTYADMLIAKGLAHEIGAASPSTKQASAIPAAPIR